MSDNELIYTESHKSTLFGFLENFLHKLFQKSDKETKANLSTVEWFIYWGILLLTLVMPFLYSRLTTENFLTPKEFFTRFFVCLLGGIFFTVAFSKKKVSFSKTTLDIALFAFFGFCAFSVIWNYNGVSALRDLRGVFIILLLFPLIANVIRSRWQVELLLWVVIFTGIATATIGFMETYNFYFKFDASGVHFVKEAVLNKIIDPNAFYLPLFPQLASPDYAMGSVVSTFGNRNYLGTFVMFVAFVPLGFFFYYKNWTMKSISLGLFTWLLYGLYMTRCRAALIGLAVGVVFMVILMLINDKKFKLIKRNRGFFAVILCLFLGGLIISAATISSESMWDKIKLTFTLDRLVSNTYERMWVWYGNNKAFTETPLTTLIGQGFGSFKHFFPLKEGEIFSEHNKESFTAVTFRQAHNDWLQIFSELGIVGMILFLFLLKRFFSSIQKSIRKDVFTEEESELNGDHMLTIAIGAAMVSQLFAALPDFPFHRIETAVFAVIFLSLVPVITETNFFKTPLKSIPVRLTPAICIFMCFVCTLATAFNCYHERCSWKADTQVREAELLMSYNANNPDAMKRAHALLMSSISLDPLPGDPYNKLAAWHQTIDKNYSLALAYADKAWRNINFNARSTYHSVTFRKLSILYHNMGKLPLAFNEATRGLNNTAGEARGIYYYYVGKIATDLLNYPEAIQGMEPTKLRDIAIKYLSKAMEKPHYRLAAEATLAIVMSYSARWEEALALASDASAACNQQDPTMLNIVGVAACNLGKNDIALDAMKKALKFSPNEPIFHRDIGTIYKQLGNIPQARTHYETAIAHAKDEQFRASLLQMLDSLNKVEK